MGSWRRALSCGVVFSGGPCLLDRVDPAELLRSLVDRISEILTSSDVDDVGASCYTASTRTVHSQSSSGSRIWTCRRSAQRSTISRQLRLKKTPSLNRRERPWSSEGSLWPRGGLSTVVEEDGGILRWCDPANAHSTPWLSPVMRRMTHCRQLAEESVRGMAETAEAM